MIGKQAVHQYRRCSNLVRRTVAMKMSYTRDGCMETQDIQGAQNVMEILPAPQLVYLCLQYARSIQFEGTEDIGQLLSAAFSEHLFL